MKWFAYVSSLICLCMLQSALALVPVTISDPSPAIADSYNRGDSQTIVYTITNNVPNRSFPITVSGMTAPLNRTIVANDCGGSLPKGPSTCNIGVLIAPTCASTGKWIKQNLSVNYQGRTPLVKNIAFSVVTPLDILRYIINENSAPIFPTSSALIPDQEYVIKDNVGYKLYYSGNDFASINLATSSDGRTWTPYPGNPVLADGAQQEHADVHFYSIGFAGANSGGNPSAATMYYRIWYQGPSGASIAGWRYAESPNGINWYNRMPITQFGTPVVGGGNTSAQYGIADVVYTPGASNTGTDWTFRIYVNVQYAIAPYSSNELTIMAFSSDGHNWTGYDPTSVGYATPVFAPTLDGVSFDADHIGWFKVIKNSPTNWQAFYSGGRGSTYQALNGIGYASSTDGIHWTRRQTLFTATGSGTPTWRNQSTWMPSVVQTETGYEIFFLGSDNPNIGSSDWIQWKLGRAILTEGC
jgi:hypothetical protein